MTRITRKRGIDYPIGYVRWTERRNMECFLDMLREGRLDLAPLINHVFPFESAVEVYERMNKGKDFGSRNPLQVCGRRRQSRAERTVAASSRRCRIEVRLGVIGAGNYVSSMLLPSFARRQDVKLVRGRHQHRVVRGQRGQEVRCSPVPRRKAPDLLAAEDIDAVLIGTRHATHAELVCAALRAGKAVFVEKPLAITRESLAGDRSHDRGNRQRPAHGRLQSPLLAACSSR